MNDSEPAPSKVQWVKNQTPIDVTEVSERPLLAPGVELVGEMKETGFQEGQFLIRRDGQFVQLTELLYRVAEQANGERTLEEMAVGVTESTQWLVSADDVRHLLQSKLIPLGLVAAADGTVASRAPASRAPSPLAFRMRARVLGPPVIDPISKVLQVLYSPFVLVPVLVAVVAAHVWLFLVHGAMGSILEVIYKPGLLLLLLPLSIAASIFHEFGHAAALRYGGGRARGMGAGIYLIFPAFYTDTTDSYRLGRWARVRTDLGGFYFHLIFALGAVVLYLATEQEFWLLLVLLINLDILRQCLPFVRFDGYWALADLTGIPDFFSQMGAFLRSVLPGRRWKGDKLPNLKPWVKAVFVSYVAVTVPVLSLLLFLFFTRLPGIAAAIWESLRLQARAFSFAMDDGNLIGMATSSGQALILGLQMLGIGYIVYSLSWMLVAGIRKRIALAR